jgi:hypothetical protein
MNSYRRYEGVALPPERLAVKTSKAAQALGCHPVTVRAMARSGRLEWAATVTVRRFGRASARNKSAFAQFS